jgi:pimeloyl-ACP methyl ester carboxylesterase
MRLVGRLTAVLAVLLCLIVAAGFGWRAARQAQTARALAITSPHGVSEARFVRLGGVDQWIQIRGQDRANPVILVLNGGPGFSMMPFTRLFQPWEKAFTVVQWDQRGEGRTLGRGGEAGSGDMSIGRMTADGLELTQYLRQHLGRRKIILLGHSWGTVLGVRMVKQRPDLFSAYVGTGELVDKAENEQANYARLMHTVRAAHDDDAIRALTAIGPPLYKSLDTVSVQLKWENKYATPAERGLTGTMAPYVLFAPNYSLKDIGDFMAGPPYSLRRTYDELNTWDARALGPKFAMPFFILQGDQDTQTPPALAKQYFDWVQAPTKAFIPLHGGGHVAMLTMPDAFTAALVTRVRPAAVAAEGRYDHASS